MRSDAVENRSSVVRAAKELFAIDGLAVPLELIAERAGVSRTTVFRHFPERSDIVNAIYEQNVEDIERRVLDAHQTDTPILDIFRFIVGMQFDFRFLPSPSDWAASEHIQSLRVRTREAMGSLMVEPFISRELNPGISLDDLLLALQMLTAFYASMYEDVRAAQARGREIVEASLFRSQNAAKNATQASHTNPESAGGAP